MRTLGGVVRDATAMRFTGAKLSSFMTDGGPTLLTLDDVTGVDAHTARECE